MFRLPPGTLGLTLAILLAFGIENLLEGRPWQILFYNLAFISPLFWPPGYDSPRMGGLVTLVTHAFLHGNMMHLVLNLGFLMAFGSFVERNVGLISFLALFVVTAAMGALTEFTFRGEHDLVLIGASGAVYGLTGAAVPLLFAGGHPDQRQGALNLVVILMGLNLLLGISGLGDLLAGARVGWKAHAGGFLAGLLCALVYVSLRSHRRS